MTKFIFSTKAETLENLRDKLKDCVLLPQVYFSVSDWKQNDDEILRNIQKKFKNLKLAIRSSALNEDTHECSMAGNYESLLNIESDSKDKLKKAIDEVIKSYLKNDQEENEKNQILIQPMVEEVKISGVMFTKDIETHAPYIVINYDDKSGSTDSVTSGNGNHLKIFTYYKNQNNMPSDPNLSNLIALARKLEEITGNDALDIEFAIDKNNVIYLLQTRPIASKNKNDPGFDLKLKSSLEKIKEFLSLNNMPYPNLYGYRTIYGVMPDWNPAEIIGISPKPLAFSLYRKLITDEIWPLSRKLIGYKDVGYQPGIYSFVGKPYVDVRMSLNTFLPENLSDITSEKLVNFYIDKLIMHPELHDKLEFNIAYTSYDFDFESKKEELVKNNFSNLQIREIKEALIHLTDNIINEKYTVISEELKLSEKLDKKREKVKKSNIHLDIKISQLIYDTKTYGTLPFSKLARFAFISSIMLKSLINKKIITPEEYENFFGSIKTVAAEFIDELIFLKEGKISKSAFIAKFGHLRPGTYDINSRSYRENFDEYIDLKNFNEKKHEDKLFNFKDDTKKRIDNAIKSEGLTFSFDQFIYFAKESIRGREEAKFKFTKNIDLILRYCEEYLSSFGFSRNDISYLEIDDIIKFAYQSKPITKIENLKEKIKKNRENYKITKAIRLPPLLYMERNIDYFHLMDDKPNYITRKSIRADIISVESNDFEKGMLDNKIVLIENADPGYDWIFSHNIKGLITKYGGVASHMSIRATEFNLPAAIGCGGALFELVKNSRKIELNCATNQIKKIL